MKRLLLNLLLCLPLCLLVAPDRYRPASTGPGEPPPEGTFAIVPDDGSPLPTEQAMLRLAETNPMAFLENCIRRCRREVRGVRLTLHKHERINGQLKRPEEIAVDYQVEPFAVLFHWRVNAGLASSVLYAREANPDKLQARLNLFPLNPVVERDVRGEDARSAGRYSLEEFGFEMAMRRTLGSWRRARQAGALDIDFKGIQKRPEVGGRACYVFHRHHYQRPEESDGVFDLVVFIDRELWLQTGSILKNADDELVGQYFFTDLQINPAFKKDRFTPRGLRSPPPAGI